MSRFVSFPNGDPRVALGKVRAAVYTGALRAVEETTLFMSARAKQNLTEAGKVDRGGVRGSIEDKIAGTEKQIEGTVVVGARYGAWIEYGRLGLISNPVGIDRKLAARAAWPPVAVIRDWVKRHVKVFAIAGRTKSGRARKATPEQIDSVTYLVGRKIANFGIKPTPFMGPAYVAARKLFATLLPKRVNEAIKGAL